VSAKRLGKLFEEEVFVAVPKFPLCAGSGSALSAEALNKAGALRARASEQVNRRAEKKRAVAKSCNRPDVLNGR